MRTLNKNTKEKIVECINEHFRMYHKTPSMGIISKNINLAKSAVSKYIHRMVDEKEIYLDKDGTIETKYTKKFKDEVIVIPLVGSISCGKAIASEENIEDYYFFPKGLIGEKDDVYFLRANGDSMIEAGISDGDIVMIKTIKNNSDINDNDIVVALIGNEVTLKRFYFDKKKKMICLHPENSSMEDIYLESCEIQGVAVKVLKNL